MKFEKAIKLLRDGKAIKRSSWGNKNYYIGDDFSWACGDCQNELNTEDILADDWEIFDQ
jgi:hypothetical protein